MVTKCLFGHTPDDVLETNPVAYILLLSRYEILWNIE